MNANTERSINPRKGTTNSGSKKRLQPTGLGFFGRAPRQYSSVADRKMPPKKPSNRSEKRCVQSILNHWARFCSPVRKTASALANSHSSSATTGSAHTIPRKIFQKLFDFFSSFPRPLITRKGKSKKDKGPSTKCAHRETKVSQEKNDRYGIPAKSAV